MLYNKDEESVMATAIQERMRTSSPAVHRSIKAIFDVFIGDRDFKGARILDVGPGQCDFLDMAKERGAITFGVDFDPAAVRLGEMRGHRMLHHNLSKGWPYESDQFDGIFCRGSINCFWFATPERLTDLRLFLDRMNASLTPEGWLWVLPFNNPAEKHLTMVEAIRGTIGEWAKKSKIAVEVVGKAERQRFSLAYSLPYIEMWTRNCTRRAERDPEYSTRWKFPTTTTPAPTGTKLHVVYEACRKRVLAGASPNDMRQAASEIFEDPAHFLGSSEPGAGDGDAYAAFIASRPKWDVIFSILDERLNGLTQGRLDKDPGTKGRVYAWGWVYWARGAVYAWRATSERRFADIVLNAYARLLDERDDSLDVRDDVRKRVVKSWSVFTPESPLRSCEVTVAGLMLLPICELLLSEGARELSDEHREALVQSVTEGLDAFDGELRVDTAFDGAFFRSPFDDSVEALNHTHAFAAALVKAYQLTGLKRYRRDAESIARYFLAACSVEENDTVSWSYAPEPGHMRDEHPPMSIELKNLKGEVGGETFYKAAVTCEFPAAAGRAGICFSEKELERVADSFLKNVSLPGDGLNLYVSSQKLRPAEEFAEKYAAQFMLICGFGLLDEVRPEIRSRLVRLFGRRPEWFGGGWFGGPAGLMILPYFMAKTGAHLDE